MRVFHAERKYDMNISITGTNTAAPLGFEPAPPAEKNRSTQKPCFSITNAPNDPEAAAAAAIPESAFAKDDALGKLFAAAFNLPAPPMPAFGG